MTSLLNAQKICFFGAGAMAEAIVRGLVEKQIAQPENIYMVNRQDVSRLQMLEKRYGVQSPANTAEKQAFMQKADIVVFAMKPKDAEEALYSVRHLLAENQLVISLIAGLPIRTIQALLQRDIPVVRTMPNTSSTIGMGATGISFSPSVRPDQEQLALQIFAAVGEVSIVEEYLLDIVTGVSGSGPAYVYYLMEAMIAAGIEGGLSEHTARELTMQTVLGAAQMVKATNEDPSELRKRVTSPNGTTQAALETLDKYQFNEGVFQAVLRAAERARELGTAIANQHSKK
jgi:pyrroline-5-carboxylate reductase